EKAVGRGGEGRRGELGDSGEHVDQFALVAGATAEPAPLAGLQPFLALLHGARAGERRQRLHEVVAEPEDLDARYVVRVDRRRHGLHAFLRVLGRQHMIQDGDLHLIQVAAEHGREGGGDAFVELVVRELRRGSDEETGHHAHSAISVRYVTITSTREDRRVHAYLNLMIRALLLSTLIGAWGC